MLQSNFRHFDSRSLPQQTFPQSWSSHASCFSKIAWLRIVVARLSFRRLQNWNRGWSIDHHQWHSHGIGGSITVQWLFQLVSVNSRAVLYLHIQFVFRWGPDPKFGPVWLFPFFFWFWLGLLLNLAGAPREHAEYVGHMGPFVWSSRPSCHFHRLDVVLTCHESMGMPSLFMAGTSLPWHSTKAGFVQGFSSVLPWTSWHRKVDKKKWCVWIYPMIGHF